ncbi:DUF3077 domain-containing protein [Pseudomonas mohnii]
MSDQLTTRDMEVSTCLSVRPGVGVEEALTEASNLMSTTMDSIAAATMGTPLQGNQAWMVRHTLESAKAIIDALWARIELG